MQFYNIDTYFIISSPIPQILTLRLSCIFFEKFIKITNNAQYDSDNKETETEPGKMFYFEDKDIF